jgi:hypothetical protein
MTNSAGHVAHMEEKKNVYRILVGKSEGRKPLGKRRCSWEDNVKTDNKGTGCVSVECINMTQKRARVHCAKGIMHGFHKMRGMD